MQVRSLRKISRPRRKIGCKSGSVISRISSFKPKSLVTVGGKRKYRKHRKVSGGSRKSYRKTKSGGRRRTRRSKSKRT